MHGLGGGGSSRLACPGVAGSATESRGGTAMRMTSRRLRLRAPRSMLAVSLAVLPVQVAASQRAELPSMDVIRPWIQEHHPQMISGDSGLNSVIIVVDTN